LWELQVYRAGARRRGDGQAFGRLIDPSNVSTTSNRIFCALHMAGIAIGVQTESGQSIGLPDKK
jgi:hypothetical protein